MDRPTAKAGEVHATWPAAATAVELYGCRQLTPIKHDGSGGATLSRSPRVPESGCAPRAESTDEAPSATVAHAVPPGPAPVATLAQDMLRCRVLQIELGHGLSDARGVREKRQRKLAHGERGVRVCARVATHLSRCSLLLRPARLPQHRLPRKVILAEVLGARKEEVGAPSVRWRDSPVGAAADAWPRGGGGAPWG